MQPLLQWKSNPYHIFWVCVCSLSYPACHGHATYCHLWPFRLYNIIPHCLISGTIFGEKKYIKHQNVLWFFLQLLLEVFLILRRTERDVIKNVCSSSCKISVIVVIFEWNLNFLDKFSQNTKILTLWFRNFLLNFCAPCI